MMDEHPGLEVDEHSITVARYDVGLSKFETRWGTFTDPWTHQPQPKCGFVLRGSAGTLSSYDYEPVVRLQTVAQPETCAVPVDVLRSPETNPIEYFLNCLEQGTEVAGPLSPSVSRIGQLIVDAAYQSAQEKRTVRLSHGD
jgi:glucose-fructose oxidoreductase